MNKRCRCVIPELEKEVLTAIRLMGRFESTVKGRRQTQSSNIWTSSRSRLIQFSQLTSGKYLNLQKSLAVIVLHEYIVGPHQNGGCYMCSLRHCLSIMVNTVGLEFQ